MVEPVMVMVMTVVVSVEVIDVVDDYNGKDGLDDSVGGPSVNSGGFRCC